MSRLSLLLIAIAVVIVGLIVLAFGWPMLGWTLLAAFASALTWAAIALYRGLKRMG